MRERERERIERESKYSKRTYIQRISKFTFELPKKIYEFLFFSLSLSNRRISLLCEKSLSGDAFFILIFDLPLLTFITVCRWIAITKTYWRMECRDNAQFVRIRT